MMHRAWELRQTTTEAESKLWIHLRLLREDGFHFRRQHAIGKYIVDFCARTHDLVIEVDGSQHIQQSAADRERTAYLNAHGFRIIRFWNDQVLRDTDAVVSAIYKELKKT